MLSQEYSTDLMYPSALSPPPFPVPVAVTTAVTRSPLIAPRVSRGEMKMSGMTGEPSSGMSGSTKPKPRPLYENVPDTVTGLSSGERRGKEERGARFSPELSRGDAERPPFPLSENEGAADVRPPRPVPPNCFGLFRALRGNSFFVLFFCIFFDNVINSRYEKNCWGRSPPEWGSISLKSIERIGVKG